MQPVWNEPALTFRLEDAEGDWTYLAASELHLGLENELARAGAFLLSRSRGLADRLAALAKAQKADRILLLGDVKHKVTHLSRQEQRDVPAFFERLAAFDRVDVTVGNHDAGLGALLPPGRFRNVRLHPATGVLLEGAEGKVAALHGHAWPSPALLAADTFLVGHTHAAVALDDEQGRSTTEWAWLRGPFDAAKVRARYGRGTVARVVVFPPFNPLCGGTPVNRDGVLGPFAKLLDLGAAELFLLDGRALGPLARLAEGGVAPRRRGRTAPMRGATRHPK